MTSAAPGVEFPVGGTPKPPSRFRTSLPALTFLAPAVFFLGVWLVYPTIRTVLRSLYDDRGDEFVGLENYERLFRDDIIFTAIKNNALWALIVPAAVTAIGLIFAVLTERIRWAVAFKIVVFMPLAVSLFAVGVIWRIMYQQDPERGAINAAIVAVQDTFQDRGVLSRANPSTDDLEGSDASGFVLKDTVQPGDVALLGLTAIRSPEIPATATDAARPEPVQGGIAGVVWRPSRCDRRVAEGRRRHRGQDDRRR